MSILWHWLHWHLSQINVDVVWEESSSSVQRVWKIDSSRWRAGTVARRFQSKTRSETRDSWQHLNANSQKWQLDQMWTPSNVFTFPCRAACFCILADCCGVLLLLLLGFISDLCAPGRPSEISPKGLILYGHSGATQTTVHEGCSRAASTGNFCSEKSAPCFGSFPFFFVFLPSSFRFLFQLIFWPLREPQSEG